MFRCWFLGFLILIVYVGAISILFLFVIMLLDIRTLQLQNTFFNHFSIVIFSGFFFVSFIFYFSFYYFDFFLASNFYDHFGLDLFFFESKSNLQIFGEILYNHFYIIAYLLVYYLLLVLVIVLLLIHNKSYFTNFFSHKKFIK